jgi:hypothetical protein
MLLSESLSKTGLLECTGSRTDGQTVVIVVNTFMYSGYQIRHHNQPNMKVNMLFALSQFNVD